MVSIMIVRGNINVNSPETMSTGMMGAIRIFVKTLIRLICCVKSIRKGKTPMVAANEGTT
jgi:hypothetical protein